MARKSSIEQMPQPIVDAVNQLIRENKHSIDDIVAWLQEKGETASRSAVGRYVKGARETMKKYAQAQEVAKVWLNKLEAEPDGDVSRLLPEMLRVVAFQTLTNMGEADADTSAQELMFLGRAIKDVNSASRITADYELKMREVRESERKKILAEQKAKLDELGKTGAVAPEVLEQVIKAAYDL